MEEYRDSTPDLDRPDKLRTRLAEEGCLFFRGLIPSADVVTVRERTLRALDDAGWLEDGTDPRLAKPGPTVVNEGDEDFFDAYTLIQAAEPFHALAHHPRLRELAGRLVGDNLLVHPRKIARISFPHNPRGTTPPHQDFRYIQGTTDVFTTWLPLGRCPADLGGLKVLRGSHENGLMPVHWNDERAVGIEVDVDPNDRDWASTEYEPGDVILFHSLTVHGAMPNHTGQIRLSADYRYQSAKDPLVGGTLKPHWYPKVPDWPELVADWRSLAPIETPGELVINEFVRGLELPPLGRSKYFEFAGQAA
jgi:hypothetical protein